MEKEADNCHGSAKAVMGQGAEQLQKELLSTTLMIRYAGEMALRKSGHLQRFTRRLMNCIRHNLDRRGIQFTIKQAFSHLVLSVDQKELTLSILSRIFGIGSYSVVERTVNSELGAIVEAAKDFIPFIQGKRFAVRAKRMGGASFKTPEVEKTVGSVLSSYGKVDLGNPERTLYVEIINKQTHLFCEKIDGPGGLPLNHRERCLVLLSGGFDSAVAAWKILKRGVACDYLFCNMGGRFHERQTLQVAKVLNDLWASGSQSSLISVNFHPAIMAIKEHIELPSYRQVILKRVMYRLAEKVAILLRSKGLVTGDSLGQVTSQSLQNIKVIDQSTAFPVLRPLVGEDKREIMDKAYQIGTGMLSEKVVELCGITKGQPVVNSKYRQVLALEKFLDEGLEENLYRSHKRLDLEMVDKDSLRWPYLLTDCLDPEATIIDCQETHFKRHWSIPGALHIPFDQLLKSYSSLDKKEKYILYCTFGSKALYAAELMQQSGREAYAFKGGVKHVKKVYASLLLG